MLDEVTSRREFKDTEERVQFRSINQEEVDNLWEELSGQIDEKNLEKYGVDEAKKCAYKGRGEPLEWRIVKKGRDIGLEHGAKIVGR